MRNFDACVKQERLSKQTLLALLDSQEDYSKGIIAQSGLLIDFTTILNPILQSLVQQKVTAGDWAYADEGNKPNFRIATNGDLLDDNRSKLVILVDPFYPAPLPVTLRSQTVCFK